uniref:Uncharacterized protein n=1 Tax=Arcella intermedia TaxID=1963864 RepID=A0A6B2LXC2_9EUKA
MPLIILSHPAIRSNSNTSIFPVLAAKCKAVSPFFVTMFKMEGYLISALIAVIFPLTAASCNPVHP